MSTHQRGEQVIYPFGKDGCFLCGKSIEQSERYIYWRGNNDSATVIFLHAECAIVLAAHLTKDALTYDNK